MYRSIDRRSGSCNDFLRLYFGLNIMLCIAHPDMVAPRLSPAQYSLNRAESWPKTLFISYGMVALYHRVSPVGLRISPIHHVTIQASIISVPLTKRGYRYILEGFLKAHCKSCCPDNTNTYTHMPYFLSSPYTHAHTHTHTHLHSLYRSSTELFSCYVDFFQPVFLPPCVSRMQLLPPLPLLTAA